jgi:dihydrofolate reductase
MTLQALPNLSIIVAVARDFSIGRNNDLLWHLSADLKRFKQITLGKTIIMGKRTFFSLPVRPLPGRKSIILSDDPNDNFDGCITALFISDILEMVQNEEECYIIGGASVYRQFMPFASKLFITWVEARYPDADVWFPEIYENEWKLVENLPQPKDEKSGLDYSYSIYERKLM